MAWIVFLSRVEFYLIKKDQGLRLIIEFDISRQGKISQRKKEIIKRKKKREEIGRIGISFSM